MSTRKKSRPARMRASAGKPRHSAKKTARRGKVAPRRAAKKSAKPKPRRPTAKRQARKPARPAAAPSTGVSQQHVEYTTQALPELRRFYTELLGFTSFEFDERAGHLLIRTGPSSSLAFMPPVEGPPEMWRPPREPALFFLVSDVDRAHAELTAKGLEFLQAPTDTDRGYRVAVLRDPEGRTVCLVQWLENV